jgi:ATP-grasp domain-containing protein
VTGACVVQIALDDWLSSARLPAALKSAGLDVIAICDPPSPLRLTRHLSSLVILDKGSELAETLEGVVDRHKPVAVIPSDERSLRRLQEIVTKQLGSAQLIELLSRSLGSPRGYGTLTSKWATAQLAQRLDIAVPAQTLVRTAAEAITFARDTGFPVILKRENTYGGMGCIVCRSETQIRLAIAKLRVASLLRRGKSSTEKFRPPEVHPLREAFIAQRFHEGPLAFATCVASNGNLVSGLAVIAEQVHPTPIGASTVICTLERPDLLEISAKLIEATGCSGFVGVDFILDATTGQPYLLEINARVTPLCQAAALLGTDLCAAFAESFTGIPAGMSPRPTTDRIALFPGEWLRDPLSPNLKTAYHDVPIDDEALIACARRRRPRSKSRWRNFEFRAFRQTDATYTAETPAPISAWTGRAVLQAVSRRTER